MCRMFGAGRARDNKQASEGRPPEAGDNAALTQQLLQHYDEGFVCIRRRWTQGVSKEMARLFLPGFSVYYTWVTKIDAHNLMHFLRLRMASDAQYEIRVYAEAINEHFFKAALPWTAEAFDSIHSQDATSAGSIASLAGAIDEKARRAVEVFAHDRERAGSVMPAWSTAFNMWRSQWSRAR